MTDGSIERDAALEEVKHNADPDWLKAADNAVWQAATIYPYFTTDEVWDILGKQFPGAATHEPRALGAVMRRWALARIIEPTDRTRKSVRASCHRRPMQVWKSRILQGEPDKTKGVNSVREWAYRQLKNELDEAKKWAAWFAAKAVFFEREAGRRYHADCAQADRDYVELFTKLADAEAEIRALKGEK